MRRAPHDSLEVASARSHRNYMRLKDQHRCIRCREQLAPDYPFTRCIPCRNANRPHRYIPASGYAERVDIFRTQLARVIETSQTMDTVEQAADLGVPVTRVYALRNRARKLGHDFPKECGGTQEGQSYRGKWASLEGAQNCIRCGLRGDHVCLQGSAADRRPTLYPEGG